jgi:hypothetical protein
MPTNTPPFGFNDGATLYAADLNAGFTSIQANIVAETSRAMTAESSLLSVMQAADASLWSAIGSGGSGGGGGSGGITAAQVSLIASSLVATETSRAAAAELQLSTEINTISTGGNVVPVATGYAQGLQIYVTGSNTVDVSANSIIMSSADHSTYVSDVLTTVSMNFSSDNSNGPLQSSTVTGAKSFVDGGAATLNPSTWYFVFAISAGTGQTSAIVTTNPVGPSPYVTNPTSLVVAYTAYARLGAIVTDHTGNILATHQNGKSVQYVGNNSGSNSGLPVLASGLAGHFNTGINTWATISTSMLVPSTAAIIKMVSVVKSCTMIVAPNSGYGYYNDLSNFPPIVNYTGSGCNTAIQAQFVIESPGVIYYACSSANGVLYCFGWEDNL